MTNYNDGKWHGWNGGECPLHPETVVECRTGDPLYVHNGAQDAAKEWDWEGGRPSSVIAFRVVKECKEPREWWVHERDGELIMCSDECEHAFLVREVTK